MMALSSAQEMPDKSELDIALETNLVKPGAFVSVRFPKTEIALQAVEEFWRIVDQTSVDHEYVERMEPDELEDYLSQQRTGLGRRVRTKVEPCDGGSADFVVYRNQNETFHHTVERWLFEKGLISAEQCVNFSPGDGA